MTKSESNRLRAGMKYKVDHKTIVRFSYSQKKWDTLVKRFGAKVARSVVKIALDKLYDK